MKYFKSAFIVSGIGLLASFLFGGFAALFTASVLAILEVSLSFDNAIVNAKQLAIMSDRWRHRFITWGMLVAVFGMRLVFPILIVSATSEMNILQTVTLAFSDPDRYSHILSSSHISIMGFGGAFLFMVFLTYFVDEAKEHHWIPMIEHWMTTIDKRYNLFRVEVKMIQLAITTVLALIVSNFLVGGDEIDFFKAVMYGLITYTLVDCIELFVDPEVGADIKKTGVAGFIYLELLDASFSFDGVISAFALTNSIVIIAIGLGIGAMFVRSLTLMLVDKGTLAQYVYLEHSAFYSIGVLALIMFINTFHEVPEVVTGLLGATLIGIGFVHSIIENRKTISAFNQ